MHVALSSVEPLVSFWTGIVQSVAQGRRRAGRTRVVVADVGRDGLGALGGVAAYRVAGPRVRPGRAARNDAPARVRGPPGSPRGTPRSPVPRGRQRRPSRLSRTRGRRRRGPTRRNARIGSRLTARVQVPTSSQRVSPTRPVTAASSVSQYRRSRPPVRPLHRRDDLLDDRRSVSAPTSTDARREQNCAFPRFTHVDADPCEAPTRPRRRRRRTTLGRAPPRRPLAGLSGKA